MSKHDNLKEMLRVGQFELHDRNFDDRVMEKIHFIAIHKEQRSKNIKLSWIFLGISVLLFPFLLLQIGQYNLSETIVRFNISFSGMQSLMPALIIIVAVIILMQIDNLYRLTTQVR